MTKNRTAFTTVLIALGLVTGGGVARAAGDGTMTREQRIEMLEKGAKAHQEAADCLKAGKPEQECHEIMKKACPHHDKKGHCHMMDEESGMKHEHGKGRRK